MADRNDRKPLSLQGAPPLQPPVQRNNSPASSRESYIAALALAGIALHFLLRFTMAAGFSHVNIPLFFVLIVGGTPLLIDLGKHIIKGEFGADLLAGISILASVLLHQYLVGSIIVLMLSGGATLEMFATRHACSVLDALARRMPSVAHRKTASGMVETKLDEIAVDDELIVMPNEICPVDGEIIEGSGTMNEAYLTGEPYEVSKATGSQVISGAINGNAVLIVRATRLAADSRYACIMRVMEESAQRRPAIRRIADRLGAWYTPLAVLVASLGWAISHDPLRFLAVIVIATPCPLLIAIPVAVIGAISVAARRAIIIKNPVCLEALQSCRTAIFDKTGTLTYGTPQLVETSCLIGIDKHHMLALAASLEQYSKHPLATALRHAAREQGLALHNVSEINEAPGHGLTGIIESHRIQLTGRSKLSPENRRKADMFPVAATGLECMLVIDGKLSSVFCFRDEPREEGQPFVHHLMPRHGINRVILLSGDREDEVKRVADALGIEEVHYLKSPEEKLAIVRAETARGPVLYVGDGINDAPAMTAATVGIAIGQTNDVTSEAADAVIMDASLGKVDELIHIGARMRRIALESAIAGMGLSMGGMLLAAAGLLPPLAGAVAQEFIDLIAVLNALRAAMAPRQLRDF